MAAGCGNRKLFKVRSIAAVGSRNADEHALAFTDRPERAIARDDFAVVSGGARGIDQTAMLSALAADADKGGTWHGAIENLKHGWVPLWVRSTPDAQSGNAALLKRGATEIHASNGPIEPLTRPLTHTTAEPMDDPNLFSHLDGGDTHRRA